MFKRIQSCFDRFWLDEINQEKIDINGDYQNKLRFYKQIKGLFGLEPYIQNVHNRSKRTWLTRFRVSDVESGRYTRPVTPLENRTCQYGCNDMLDDENHAILVCGVLTIKRNCFLGKMSSLLPDFENMSAQNKLLTILCPKNYEIAVCVSKYLGIISNTRKKLDMGLSDDMLGIYTKH